MRQSARQFRRGRTVAGDSKNRPALALARDDLRSLARRRSSALRLLLGSLAVVIITTFILGFSIHNQVVITDNQQVSGQELQNYAKIIDDYFYERPLERLKLALDIDALNTFLTARAPEVLAVDSIETNFVQASLIRLRFRRAVVMWQNGEEKNFVDKAGVAFSKNYFEEPAVSVIDKSGVSLGRLKQVANNDFLGFIGQVVALSSEKNLQVEQVVIPPLTTRQLELRFKDKPYAVKMTSQANVAKQVEDASKAVKYLQNNNLTPAYIDVRVERKVYYK